MISFQTVACHEVVFDECIVYLNPVHIGEDFGLRKRRLLNLDLSLHSPNLLWVARD